MNLLSRIKNNPRSKKFVLFLLISKGESKPRLWVKWFLNPFLHYRDSGSKIRFSTRMDLFPFQDFKLGKNSIIEEYSVVNNGVGKIIIGDRVMVGISNILIGPVEIGNDVIIAQHVVISGLNHCYENITIPIHLQGVKTDLIKIESEVWIGANSLITAGITIGKHSVIAGGSVVTKDVPPYTIVAGNPAKPIKQYNNDSKKWEKIIY